MTKFIDIFTGEEREIDTRKVLKRFDLSRPRRSEFPTKAAYHQALIQRAKSSTCKCRHPRFRGGVCCYRTCYHDKTNHYGDILPHDNDDLDVGDKILLNVEPIVEKHPEQFAKLKELLDWVKVGLAKCHCDFPIRRQDLQYYTDHDGGLNIPYESTKCWIFSHCPKCGYDYSFPKIMNQRSWRMPEEKINKVGDP